MIALERIRLSAPAQRFRTLGDSPAAVALLSILAGVIFVVGRLLVVAHGDVSIFIVVGSIHVVPGQLPHGIAVNGQVGYDGQFYYRIALDPADLARSAFGIRMDTVSRFERIGYPAIAWLLAGGRTSLVPYTLIATNVLALGALGFGGALFARDSGRHAMWGLTLAGFWGYLWSTGRDLTEITAAAFLILGLAAYRKHRSVLTGFLLLGAVLSKESAAYVVVIIAASRILGWLAKRDKRPPGTADIAWALPLVGFAAWQAVVIAATGTVPLLGSGQANLGLPFVGLVDAPRHFIAGMPSVTSTLWLGEFVVLMFLAVAAALSIRRSTVPIYERIAWVAVVVIAICVSPGIWLHDAGFRSIDDVYLFSWIVLLGHTRRLWLPAAMVATAWLVVAVELIKFV